MSALSINFTSYKPEQAKELTTDYVEKLKSTEKEALVGVNKWTDNIFALISWAKKKFFMDIRPKFKIPADLDYEE